MVISVPLQFTAVDYEKNKVLILQENLKTWKTVWEAQ